MYLQDFFDYKNKLMEDLLTNEEVVRLLDADIEMEDAPRLAYKQVFPCEYVPETVHDGATFICFDVDIQEAVDKTFYSPTLYIWVFSHRSQLRLPEGGVRTDKLCSEIAKQIDGSREYGLGQIKLYSVRRFAPMTDYQGKCLTFRMKEFSKVYDGNRYMPSKRKDY